jgi:drug/metabolite transporter (DMT)-like permease
MGRLEDLPAQGSPEQNDAELSASEQNASDQNGGYASESAQTAESLLRSVTQDLKSLQQEVLTQLNQDVYRLQAEKSRLLNDIEKLQTQQQSLQSQHQIDLSQQQLAQQQAWAKQLALVLANHLQTALNDRLNQTLGSYQANGAIQPTSAAATAPATEQSYRLAASLDDTVNRTFASLRHDINSYQSSLAQQLERMHTLGQQGEAILEVLVKRLSQQLQVEARQSAPSGLATGQLPPGQLPPGQLSPGQLSPGQLSPGSRLEPNFPPREINPPARLSIPSDSHGLGSGRLTVNPDPASSVAAGAGTGASSGLMPSVPASWMDALTKRQPEIEESFADAAFEVEEEPTVEPTSARPPRRRVSNLKLGLGLVFLSTLVISLHYVTVGILGNASQLFGKWPIGGYLNLNSFGNSALLLWIRMLVVVPLMAWLAPLLYPATLREVRAFTRSQDRRVLFGVVGSGIFLFLSQVFLYIAIGQTGPGVGVTLLFLYPIGTLIIGWLIFGEKLTFKRVGMILGIGIGALLAASPLLSATNPASSSVVAGVISAVTFTLYLATMQIGARKIHPIPVSLMQFATMFVLSSISLMVFRLSGTPTNWIHLLIGGALLGMLTIASYSLNHFGIRALGAARSAIIAANTPVLTALLAFFLAPGALTSLNWTQIAGVLIVTLGGTIFSLERMLQSRAIRLAKQREQEQLAAEEA